jgi:hypothetical protein
MAAPPGAWQDNDLVSCQPDGRPWLPDHVSKRFKRLATEAAALVVKLNEGGRHTGNSLMYDAEIRPDLVMRRVGHASQEMSQRYNHPGAAGPPGRDRSSDGTRQRGRKRVLSGTDVPRMFPTAAVPRTSQPGQITGFRR